MARKYLDVVAQEIVSLMPDNVVGLITPEIQRGVLTDILHSTSPLSAEITGDGALVATSPVMQLITDGYALEFGGDGNTVIPSPGLGYIETADFAGWEYVAAAAISYSTGNNKTHRFAITIDGDVGIAPQFGATSAAPNAVTSITPIRTFRALAANQQIGLSVSGDTSDDIDILSITLNLTVVPTWSAI